MEQHAGFAWPELTPAVKRLLLINGIVFVVNLLVGGRLIEWFGASWSSVTWGYGLGVFRLVTAGFVHSYVEPFHLIFNMLVLYMFGTMVEGSTGRVGMYRLYLVSVVVGNVCHLLLMALTGSDALAVGASGACYGIMVFAAMTAPRMRVFLLIFPVEMRWLVGLLVGVGVYMTLLELRGDVRDSTAHGAHLGGALWGFLAHRFFRSWHTTVGYGGDWGAGRGPGMLGKVRAWRAARDRKRDDRDREVMDQLLDKVKREGVNALSAAERRFMERTSNRMRDR